jgi:uncharacterized protein (DUF4415 family)
VWFGGQKTKEQDKRAMPTVAAAAEETEWWRKDRNVHGEQMLRAAAVWRCEEGPGYQSRINEILRREMVSRR